MIRMIADILWIWMSNAFWNPLSWNLDSIQFETVEMMCASLNIIFILFLQLIQFTYCKQFTNNVDGDELIFAQTVSPQFYNALEISEMNNITIFGVFFSRNCSCVVMAIEMQSNHFRLIHLIRANFGPKVLER